MTDFELIDVRAGVEAENGSFAALVREFTDKNGIFLINLMASPGAGKTSAVCRLLERLAGKYRITGASCHMDAKMTLRGLEAYKKPLPEIIILENVGNLVCPAEFDVGADLRVMILSVPEGDDKPLKYPLMFEVSDIMLINKTDTADIFDFDAERCEKHVRALNPGIEIFRLSAKTGEGTGEFADRIDSLVSAALAKKRKGEAE